MQATTGSQWPYTAFSFLSPKSLPTGTSDVWQSTEHGLQRVQAKLSIMYVVDLHHKRGVNDWMQVPTTNR